jgi:hypothetical protein
MEGRGRGGRLIGASVGAAALLYREELGGVQAQAL